MKIFKIWIGNKPIPDTFKKYTDTWSILTDAGHEIVEVGNEYIDKCLSDTDSECLKWCIFNRNYTVMNHYLRYWLLYKYGGIYLDLDVQCVRPIREMSGFYIGMESDYWINNAVMIAEKPGHEFMLACMSEMDSMDMTQPEIELTTGPRLVTNLIMEHTNFKRRFINIPHTYTFGKDHITVFPEVYFSPHRWNQKFKESEIKEETYFVHHFEHSWGK